MSSLKKKVIKKNHLVDNESDRDDFDSDAPHVDVRGEEDSFNHHFSAGNGLRVNNNEDAKSFDEENDFECDDVFVIDDCSYDSEGSDRGSDCIYIDLSDCEDLCDIPSEVGEISDFDTGAFQDYKIFPLFHKATETFLHFKTKAG